MPENRENFAVLSGGSTQASRSSGPEDVFWAHLGLSRR